MYPIDRLPSAGPNMLAAVLREPQRTGRDRRRRRLFCAQESRTTNSQVASVQEPGGIFARTRRAFSISRVRSSA